MLYTCSDDFFRHVDEIKHTERLTHQEEKAYARRMAEGDEEARERLFNNYLPMVAAYIKRWHTEKTSLEMIYRAIAVLEKSLQQHNFENDYNSFARMLSNRLRQTLVRYIAGPPTE